MRLAVIGLGERTGGLVQRLLSVYSQVQLAAVVDPDAANVNRRLSTLNLATEPRRFSTLDELLNSDVRFDAGMIGTRCSSHATLACQFAATQLPLYLEKPVAVNWQQYQDLELAFNGREHSVVVSFPLRRTQLLEKVMTYISEGALGTINQVQAVNNVPYGGVYFGQWYRSFEETGGLWLQKATHDFDYINRIVSALPVRIASAGTRRIFGGDMPETLTCSACEKAKTCAESPENIKQRGDHGGMGKGDHLCAFSSSIRHHDSGSAIVVYANGVHASYSQNFVTRRTAARRGAVITGYEGTLEFDWYSSSGRLVQHHGDQVQTFSIPPAEGHDGGDDELLKDFVELVEGREKSRSDITAGLLSVSMCLAAQKSEEEHSYETIRLPQRLNSVGNK